MLLTVHTVVLPRLRKLFNYLRLLPRAHVQPSPGLNAPESIDPHSVLLIDITAHNQQRNINANNTPHLKGN